MVVRRAPALWIVLLAGLVLRGDVYGDEPQEWQREAGPELFFVSPLDAEGRSTHVVMRIVDDLDGAPLPGATVALHSQVEHPVTGLVPPERTGVADADGWVRLRVDDLGWEDAAWQGALWAYVDAPGHGGVAREPGTLEGVVRLGPACDVVVEVRDALDRPVAGALVGVRADATCGHMPDQRAAVTGDDGRARITGLGRWSDRDGMGGWEAWVAGHTLRGRYHRILTNEQAPPMQVLRHEAAWPVEGCVLDADGAPAAGLHVGVLGGNHRGPWCVTDQDGHFRLVGAPPLSTITVVRYRDDEGFDEVAFRAAPPGIRQTLRLPAVGTQALAPALYDVALRLVETATGEPLAAQEVRLIAVRDEDGLTRAGRDWEGGVRLPPGTWTLTAGGPTTPFVAVGARLEVVPTKGVSDGEPPAIALDLVRHPPLRIGLDGDAERTTVAWSCAAGTRDLTEEEVNSGAPSIPIDIEGVLLVTSDTSARSSVVRVPVGPRRWDAEPLHLVAPRRVVVGAALRTADGVAVPGWLVHPPWDDLRGAYDGGWAPTDDDAALDPETTVDDLSLTELLAVPVDGALRPRRVPLAWTPQTQASARMHLGAVRLEPYGDPRVVVLDRHGAVVRAGSVRIVRGDIVWQQRPGYDEDAEGFVSLGLPLEAGDLVEVLVEGDEDGAVPWPTQPLLRQRLVGDGPWTLRAAATGASLSAMPTDEEGEALQAMLVIDGVPYGPREETGDAPARLHVTGLVPGPHLVAVAAQGHVTHLHRVVLQDGEHRLLRPRMRRAR